MDELQQRIAEHQGAQELEGVQQKLKNVQRESTGVEQELERKDQNLGEVQEKHARAQQELEGGQQALEVARFTVNQEVIACMHICQSSAVN